MQPHRTSHEIPPPVLPYTPDAWIDPDKTQVGYEISFTRHFYKPEEMRTLEQIKADIAALERENEGLLEEIVGELKEDSTLPQPPRISP